VAGAGQTYRIERVVNGVLIPSMTIPFDHEPLRQLYQYIARGLAFVRWGLLLPPETCIVHAEFLSSAGQGLFQQLFGLGMQQRVSDGFGNGVFAQARMHGTPIYIWEDGNAVAKGP
jgi:hypothetical protein